MSPAIETRGLSRDFGPREAVRDLDLTVESGSIYALIGPNGAGKTTTLRMLLRLLRPSGGRASVLGTDVRELGARDFARIGYVSADSTLPRRERVVRLLHDWKPFYPTWDDALCARLVERFALPFERRVSQLSRGERVKLELILALAFRPRLLVLDEPFGGLDPLVREELIEGTLELAGSDDWAVLVSSHDLAEVERLADHVGYLNGGRLAFSDSLERLHDRYREIEVELGTGDPAGAGLPDGWLDVELGDRLCRFVDREFDASRTPDLVRQIFPGARNIHVSRVSLQRIFLATAKTHRPGGVS